MTGAMARRKPAKHGVRMTVKFIPLALIEDPDDRFYCWGCGDWNATICIVGDDDGGSGSTILADAGRTSR